MAEYAAYLHPHNFDYTQDYEVSQTMARYDKNADHVVDLQEYMGDKGKTSTLFLTDLAMYISRIGHSKIFP